MNDLTQSAEKVACKIAESFKYSTPGWNFKDRVDDIAAKLVRFAEEYEKEERLKLFEDENCVVARLDIDAFKKAHTAGPSTIHWRLRKAVEKEARVAAFREAASLSEYCADDMIERHDHQICQQIASMLRARAEEIEK